MWNKSPSSQSRASRMARQCPTVWTEDPDLRPQTRQSGIATLHSAPVYVGPRRSGQSLPPVPSPQFYAESAEPFGLVILAGSNLLRLHFRQRLPSAGPTHPCEGRSNCALFPGQCQSRKDRHPSHQRPCVRLLPRPTALPPMPFVSGYSHGYRRRCIRPQTAQAI